MKVPRVTDKYWPDDPDADGGVNNPTVIPWAVPGEASPIQQVKASPFETLLSSALAGDANSQALIFGSVPKSPRSAIPGPPSKPALAPITNGTKATVPNSSLDPFFAAMDASRLAGAK